jgi:pimeloyl-ACP methyl ester carboxylesterase
LGFNQQLVRMGPSGKAVFKSMYKLAGLNPWVFKLAMGIYTTEARRLYANPKTAEALEQSLYNFQQLDLEAIAQYFKVMPDMDITPWLSSIQAPALVVASEDDPTVPSDEARKIASLIPGAELAIIPGKSHLSFLERPVEYRAALAAWLEKTS